MKFLLDANIPYSAKEVVSSFGDVLHVRDVALATVDDSEIIKWAKKHKAILITRDLDFANILHFPPVRHTGIVVLRLPSFYTVKDITRVLRDSLKSIDLRIIPGATLILEEGRVRIRRK